MTKKKVNPPLSETTKDLLSQLWVLQGEQGLSPLLGILADKLEEDGDNRHTTVRREQAQLIDEEDTLDDDDFFRDFGLLRCPDCDSGVETCPTCQGGGMLWMTPAMTHAQRNKISNRYTKALADAEVRAKEAKEKALYAELHRKYGVPNHERKTKGRKSSSPTGTEGGTS